MKNPLQLEEPFTISRRLSKAYFVSSDIFQKKTDNPTGVLVWKHSFPQMENDAITILVQNQ